MRNYKTAVSLAALAASLILSNVQAATPADLPFSPHAQMKEIHWTDVKWTEGFWAEKFDLCHREIIPAVGRGLLDPRNSEHLDNLKIAAGLQPGEYSGTEWSDGDCYKWIEAMAFMFAVTHEPELDRLMDEWIAVTAKAQQPDGYN